MKNRFRLIRRGERHQFYCVDNETGQRTSLKTSDRDTAEQIILARNQSLRQPMLNRQIAKAYLSGTDAAMASRTWQEAFEAIVQRKHGPTRERWERAIKNLHLNPLRKLVIVETQPDHLWQVLNAGTVSTNVQLRELHNFVLAMGWLPWPVIAQRQWPKIRYGPKRAITLEEHQRIVAREYNAEYKAFYELCWYLGGSQSDMAGLFAENIDWRTRVIAYARKKTQSQAHLHIGPELEAVLRRLPAQGPLFPRLSQMKEKHRAKEFRRRCVGLAITEGSTRPVFHNAGTLGDGWMERYGIDAVVHEFNCNWIAGVKDFAQGRHWQSYGENLATVFYEYFGLVKP